MAYGLKYLGEFSDYDGAGYRVEILENNYYGTVTPVTLGGTPVVHSYEADDIYKSIKGSRLEINLIGIGIEMFIADSDLNFKVILKKNNQVKFVGWLSQDDYTELYAEHLHEITLTAVDALGYLRDKKLNENNIFTQTATSARQLAIIYDTYTIQIDAPSDNAWITPGNKIVISSYDIPVGQINGTYTIKESGSNGIKATIVLVEPLPAAFPIYDVDFYFLIHEDLQKRLPIQYYIDACLSLTNLNLMQVLDFTLKETGKINLFESMIDGRSFMTDDTSFMSCYDVLDKILSRFKITLQQVNGEWLFTRWLEFTKTVNPDINLKPFTKIMGVEKSIKRPFGYVSDTFELKQRKNIIRNLNLLELGNVIGYEERTVDGKLNKITYYEAKFWAKAQALDVVKIAVVKNQYDIEIDRYLSVKGYAALTSQELFNKDDIFELNFTVTSINSTSGTTTLPYGLIMSDGTDAYGLSSEQRWKKHGTEWYGSIYLGRHWAAQTNTDLKQGFSVSINSENAPIPIDGYFFLSFTGGGPGNTELQYRNISLTYAFIVNKSKQIKAQKHSNTRNNKLLNIDENDIFIDECIKFQANGALYSDTEHLATDFEDTFGNYSELGKEIIDLLMLQSSFPALMFEGEIIADVEMSNVIKIDDKYLVPVYLQKNYKKGEVNCKFVEIRNLALDNSGKYKFEYIYGKD